MHLFVTGGTGFFGKALLRHWSREGRSQLTGARITLLSRNPGKFRKENAELLSELDVRMVEGDIQYLSTLPEGDYTHVLHAATDSTAGLELPPLQRFDQIVLGTRNVLELARRSGKPRVLMTSSGGVYGNISQFPNGVPEDYTGMPDPLEAQNAYSIAKRQAEHLCALYRNAYGLHVVIARCFAFVGEDLPLNSHFAIGNFIRDAIAGNDIVIQGDGTPIRSYMDQRELAHWLTVMLFDAVDGGVYNVGSAQAFSLIQIADSVAALAPHKRTRVKILKQTVHGQSAQRNFYIPDISRAHDQLGLDSCIGLNEAIRHVIDLRCG